MDSPARCNTCETNPVDPESLQPYLFWNAQHYTRNLSTRRELYELLAICWESGMRAPSTITRDKIAGWLRPSGGWRCRTTRLLSEDLAGHRCNIVPTDCVEITSASPVAVDPLNPVHDVSNPREWGQRAVSLHVYSRPFDSCIVYSVEQSSCGEIGLHYTSMFGKLC